MSLESASSLIAELINSAKEEKQGIYSDEPQVTPNQLTKEVEAAEVEFSRVIDKELKRIKVFADRENDRILELRRQNEVEVTCPICLEVIPAIAMEGGELGMQMFCCGVRYHRKCYDNWQMRLEMDPTISAACLHCRRFVSNSSDECNMIFLEEVTLTGSTVSKANVLKHYGDAYENGTDGKRRNLKEALKYFEKASELGNQEAQSRLAVIHHFGEFHELSIPKSQEKAMDMAQRAADQGDSKAQYLLGVLLTQDDIGMDTASEAHRLYSLSAYQGNHYGIMALEDVYYNQYKNLEGEANTSVQESRRESLLLCVYWTGRLVNKKEDFSYLDSTMRFFSHFQAAMSKLWQVRSYFELDPLTGYSHIPLFTSMYSVLRKDCEKEEHLLCSLFFDTFKYACTNCGKQGGKECVLKTCARCKAFSYCSKECQVKHWKAGHKVDCKGRHWIESYFPNFRMI